MSADSSASPPAGGAPGAPSARRTREGHEAIDSRSGFHAAVRAALAEAARAGCKDLVFVDRDFADWPLGEAGVVESLTQWAYAHRRLTLIAAHFDEVPRRHPRFVRWRVQYAHVVEARAAHEDDARELPTLLHAPGLLALRLFDPVRYRGAWDRSAAEDARCRDLVDVFTQRSHESFPASTLGL